MLKKMKSAWSGRKMLFSLLLSATILALAVLPAWAQAGEPINLQPGYFPNIESLTIQNIISAAIKLILLAAALVFFFLLIIGGIQFMTSGGDKTASEAARGRITAALIGLVIVFAAWAIGTLINYFFGVNIFSLNIPSAYQQ